MSNNENPAAPAERSAAAKPCDRGGPRIGEGAMRGGRKSRDKGNRAERAIVRLLQERGFAAERVPLSGAAGGSYRGDINVPVLGVDRVVEVKCRANGFRALYAWLTDRDILIVRADRREPLCVLPLRLAADVAAKAAGHEKP
jgi:hypothetical protein